MLKSVLTKLHSHAGETIGETLVALLISALAMLMLAGAISSAAKLVTRNSTAMKEYYVESATGTISQQEETYNNWKTTADTSLKQ